MNYMMKSLEKSKIMIDDLMKNKNGHFSSIPIPKPIQELEELGDACVQALSRGKKIIFIGNGGSAAEAQHFAAELVGRFGMERGAYAAIALTTDTSIITAVGNDYGVTHIFSRQIEAIGNQGDVAIHISTSGNSENILDSMRICKIKGITTASFTGKITRHMHPLSDYYIAVPSDKVSQIQEGHLILGHILCGYIEKTLVQKQLEKNADREDMSAV